MQILNVGVDVAKATVVVACAEQAFTPKSVVNRRAELRAWLKTLPAGSRLGVEATGGYHERLADLAHERGLTVYVLNPKDTRYYAKGLGRRGKTDRVDAEVIARYVAKEHTDLHPYVPPTPDQRVLDRLLRRRARLVVLRNALRATGADLPVGQPELKEVMQRMEQLIDRLDEHRDHLTAQSPERQATQQRLNTIIGVGPVVGAGLSQALLRIPFASADAFVAYTGLDPRPCDSGQKTGRRRLSKRGPGELRRLLYNAAMSAAKTPTWKPLYERYRARGLPSTAALVVIARKIARIAWSIQHHHTAFDPARLSTA
jgi:Transposase and inactivated derivatives